MDAKTDAEREALRVAMQVVDTWLAENDVPIELRQAWRTCRTEIRTRSRRVSEQLLPSLATASMHTAQAIAHSQRAMEALGDTHAVNRNVSTDVEVPKPPAPDPE